MDKLIRSLLASIKQANKKKTSSYDTTAQVRRIEGNVAWVHIPGGVDETPVKLTVNAEPGDTVQLRVGGGTAWITGNQTAPPTDDTKAKEADTKAKDANILAKLAKKTADQAGKTATNYLSWSSEYGLIVSEDATENVEDLEGANIRLASNGLDVYKGQTKVASFGQTVEINAPNGSKLAIGATAITMYRTGGQKVFEVDTGPSGRGTTYHLGDETIYDDQTLEVDRTGGPSDVVCTPYAVKYDRVIQLRLDISSNTSVASGSNIFEGTIATAGFSPKLYVAGVGYYGSHAIVGRITPTGGIVIRNASSSAVTVSGTVTVTFTYIAS